MEAPVLAPGVLVKFTASKKARSGDVTAVAEYSLRAATIAAKAVVDGTRLVGSLVWGTKRLSAGVRTDLDSLYHTVGDPELVAQYRGDAFAVTAVHKVGPGGEGLRVWAERRLAAPLTAAVALTAADRAATAGLAYQWGDGNQVKGKVSTVGGGWGTWSAGVTLGSLLPRAVLRACLEVDGGDKFNGDAGRGRARLGASASVTL